MFLDQVSPGVAIELINSRWFPLETCMRLACVNRAHRSIIQNSRWHPLIIDEALQKAWKAYIESKNTYVKIDRELETESLAYKKLSQLNTFSSCATLLPTPITNLLQRCIPFIRKAAEYNAQIEGQVDKVASLQLCVSRLKGKTEALRIEFCKARDDVRVSVEKII
ncbi:MAG: hypothetical protein JSR46_01435 [Verrucomicrobia bacterium]|nr:hypothetical protein [Verrucomicrobiota bacterium]